jgi:insertion element IS1 protein InsB
VCFAEIACPSCSSWNIKKNGTTANRKQNYRGTDCCRQFLTDYTDRGRQPLTRDLIVPMTMNSSRIRDIARVFHSSPNPVLKTMRERAALVAEPRVPPRSTDLEIDEFWSLVKDKSRQCWCWDGLNRATTRIAAYVLARRTDRSGRHLVEKLSGSAVEQVSTDDWPSYAKTLPPERHPISKAETRNIERHNLNFRTQLKRLHRRTICFSKSAEMHAAVIKLYVNHVNASQHKL